MFNSNKDLSKRFKYLEEALTVRNLAGSVITTRGEDDTETIRPSEEDGGRDKVTPEPYHFRFDFETILEASRVYKKSWSCDCDISIRSSMARSHAWSSFSDLSLAQFSVISVFALPLYPGDICNRQWYSFGDAPKLTLGGNEVSLNPIILATNKDSETRQSLSEPETSGLIPVICHTPVLTTELIHDDSNNSGNGDNDDSDDDTYPCKACGEVSSPPK